MSQIKTPQDSTADRFPTGLLLLFTLSGATGLILEVVWSRMLSLLLGVTTWGILTVLVVYLGGLGLGSILLGRRASRSTHPLRFYGLLEVLIGCYALAVPWVFKGITLLYAAVFRMQEDRDSLRLAAAVRLFSAILALGFPTILLGGTFPSLSRALAQGRGGKGHGGRGAALLYAMNTGGAVVGCFVAGFVLIARLGVGATNVLAGILDITIGLAAIRMSRHYEISERVETDEMEPPARKAGLTGVVLFAAACSGFCGLAFEVLWTRGLLVALVDNTTYAFTMMLTAFLAGHAIGSGWFGWRRGEENARLLARRLADVLASAGFLALVSMPMLILASEPMGGLAYGPGVTFWGRRVPIQMGLCLLVVGPTAAMLGGAFALAARLLIGKGRNSAREAGRLYGVNTVAAILGATLTQITLIPALGTQTTLVGLALLLVVVSVRLRIAAIGFKLAAAGSIACFAAAAVLAFGAFQFSLIDLYASKERLRTANAPAKLLGVIESPGAIVTIHERGPDDRVINLNGTNVAGTNPVLRTIQTLQGELPFMLHPDPKAVLQIGFGSGGTYATLNELRPPGMTIEVLELTPEVIKASERWLRDVNRGTLSASSDRVTINDARSHMIGSGRTYDLILSDSIHPRFRGNASLYSRDYFELCARRLRPGGLFSTWLPLYGMSVDDLKGIFASLRAVFPHVQIWYPNGEPNENTVLVGSMEPIRVDAARFRRFLESDLAALDRPNRLKLPTERVLDFFLLGDEGVSRFVAGAKISTDDRPHLEFDAPLTLKRQESWRDNFASLLENRESVTKYLTNGDPALIETIRRWEAGTTFKLRGQIDELDGKFLDASREYARCAEANPDDREAGRRGSLLGRAANLPRP